MTVAEDQLCSSREAVAPKSTPEISRPDKSFSSDLGKQVATDNGKQTAFNRSGLELAANANFFTDQTSTHPIQDRHVQGNKWIVMTSVIVSIITLAIVLEAVLGSRHTTHSKMSATSWFSPTHASPPPPKRNIAAISFNHNSTNNDHVYFIDSQGNIMEAANSEKHDMAF